MNVKSFIRFIETERLFSREDHILLAVSGGIDSTVMAHLFHHGKFRFAIAHCNFGLRGTDSDTDAGFVKTLALQFKVPFYSETFNTSDVALQQGISIQMAARELRYAWFEKIRQEHDFDYVATAHHLDDQVETFLINLIRGTGIAGLHGIPVKNKTIIRPLMYAFRSDIEQYALENQVKYRLDNSNNETKYIRNKIRHSLIPLFCSINPEFTHRLTETIRRLREFEQVGNSGLDNWCTNALISDGKDYKVDIRHLLEIDPVEPFAWALLSPFGLNETQVSNLLGCLRQETRKVFRSDDYRIIKERGQLIISKTGPPVAEKSVKIGAFLRKKKISKPVQLSFNRIGDVKNYEINASGTVASIDFDKLQFPITLRKWKAGDSFFPLGMKKRKKLSDFFIDQKFSLKDKEQAWLLCSGKEIVWIIGHRIDHRYRVTAATKEILKIVTRDG